MTSTTPPVDSPEEETEPTAGGQQPPAQSGRPRLTWRLVVPAVTAAAGVMFAMSFQAAQGGDLRADRDLPQLIMDGDAQVAVKAARLDALQREVDSLSTTRSPSDERLASLTKRADELAPTAATTKVRGAAIEVALDDARRTADSLPDGFTADDIVVHQQDVQAVVNALWGSGAEAMMIQDQRVIATSAVQCVGNTLLLQGRVYSPPYVIKAIGNPTSLKAALDRDPQVRIYREWVDAVGLGYDVATTDQADFPAYTGTIDLDRVTGG